MGIFQRQRNQRNGWGWGNQNQNSSSFPIQNVQQMENIEILYSMLDYQMSRSIPDNQPVRTVIVRQIVTRRDHEQSEESYLRKKEYAGHTTALFILKNVKVEGELSSSGEPKIHPYAAYHWDPNNGLKLVFGTQKEVREAVAQSMADIAIEWGPNVWCLTAAQ